MSMANVGRNGEHGLNSEAQNTNKTDDEKIANSEAEAHEDDRNTATDNPSSTAESAVQVEPPSNGDQDNAIDDDAKISAADKIKESSSTGEGASGGSTSDVHRSTAGHSGAITQDEDEPMDEGADGPSGDKGKMAKTDSMLMRTIDKQAPLKEEKITFPSTLEGFKYRFNGAGEMRHTETDERFVFNVNPDHRMNQLHYEALGEVITQHVYSLLETTGKLKRVTITPPDRADDEPESFFFMSDDALTSDKLMLLIHGSGVVRAGQWARRLIMNDCLDSGTQLPYISRAMQEGYGVIVLNTNHNHVTIDGDDVFIRDNETPEDHACTVWDRYITNAAATHIAIVAHSYGGVVTTELAISREAQFQDRVFAVAFTDSVHNLDLQNSTRSIIKFFKQKAQNWVSSRKELDQTIRSGMMDFFSKDDCPRVSAGTEKHEVTSWSAFESVFKFIASRLQATTTGPTTKKPKKGEL